jgi:hypothetical protein
MSMMERRPWSRRLNRQLPVRFRDEVPQSLPSLPTESAPQPAGSANVELPSIPSGQSIHPSLAASIVSDVRRIFTTPRNVFGLSRQFYGKEMPLDDREAYVTLSHLSNISVSSNVSLLTSQSFYPFPNRSAFLMSDWFWNGGVQKSLQSFRELMKIIGDSEFRIEDVRDVNWDQVHNLLVTDEEEEWVDEDAGWVRSSVIISVPYQRRRGQPSDPHAGPRNYIVDDFYHRKLVSIIRQKISALDNNHLFHTEPHEIFWQPINCPNSIRVQGELYTSPSFINAHRELQDSPKEPGCDLPRVIAALMFWSDATQLTSFGNAKLWPLYLFFGNDSKYIRCKPSCHLCEHVAYFRSVSYIRTI